MRLTDFPKDKRREEMKGFLRGLERKRENILVTEGLVSLSKNRVAMHACRCGEKKRRREETLSLYLSHELRQIWASFLERRA